MGQATVPVSPKGRIEFPRTVSLGGKQIKTNLFFFFFKCSPVLENPGQKHSVELEEVDWCFDFEEATEVLARVSGCGAHGGSGRRAGGDPSAEWSRPGPCGSRCRAGGRAAGSEPAPLPALLLDKVLALGFS